MRGARERVKVNLHAAHDLTLSQVCGAQAWEIFRTAAAEGQFAQQAVRGARERTEVNLHAMTAGVAVLSLYAWLLELRAAAQRSVTGLERGGGGGGGALPARLAIVTDRGKSCREQGNLVVKEAVAAVMIGWGSPFRCAQRFRGHVTSLTESRGRVMVTVKRHVQSIMCRPPAAHPKACWRRQGPAGPALTLVFCRGFNRVWSLQAGRRQRVQRRAGGSRARGRAVAALPRV